MAYITINTKYPVYDGQPITFQAPCDCTATDGLKVNSQNFVLKDAHGVNLAGVGNVFTQGVFVKVILDVTNGCAYIQNADTNSYLESKSSGGGDFSVQTFNLNEMGLDTITSFNTPVMITNVDTADIIAALEQGPVNFVIDTADSILGSVQITPTVVGSGSLWMCFATWDAVGSSASSGIKMVRVTISGNSIMVEVSNTPVESSGTGSTIVVDAELSEISENPVQNKVISKVVSEAEATILELVLSVGSLNERVPPVVSESDNGKVLTVVDGAWAAASAPEGGGSTTIPEFDLAALGLAALPVDGTGVEADFDTSSLLSALESGAVRLHFNVNYESNGSVVEKAREIIVSEYTVEYSSTNVDGYFVVRLTDYFEGTHYCITLEIYDDCVWATKVPLVPYADTNYNDNVLQVVGGKAQWVSIENSSIKTYIDNYISEALEGDY